MLADLQTKLPTLESENVEEDEKEKRLISAHDLGNE